MAFAERTPAGRPHLRLSAADRTKSCRPAWRSVQRQIVRNALSRAGRRRRAEAGACARHGDLSQLRRNSRSDSGPPSAGRSAFAFRSRSICSRAATSTPRVPRRVLSVPVRVDRSARDRRAQLLADHADRGARGSAGADRGHAGARRGHGAAATDRNHSIFGHDAFLKEGAALNPSSTAATEP